MTDVLLRKHVHFTDVLVWGRRYQTTACRNCTLPDEVTVNNAKQHIHLVVVHDYFSGSGGTLLIF